MGIARLPTDTDTFIYRRDIRRVIKLKDSVSSTIYKHLHLSDGRFSGTHCCPCQRQQKPSRWPCLPQSCTSLVRLPWQRWTRILWTPSGASQHDTWSLQPAAPAIRTHHQKAAGFISYLTDAASPERCCTHHSQSTTPSILHTSPTANPLAPNFWMNQIQNCTPLLQLLNRLPISEWIKYRTAFNVLQPNHRCCPFYVSEQLHLYSASCPLCFSSDTCTLKLQCVTA